MLFILGIFLIFCAIVILGFSIFNNKSYKGLLFFCVIVIILGIFFMLYDRITEVTIPNLATLKSTVKQISIDANTVSDLKKRVESQSATIDLVAKSADDASKLTKEVSRKSEQINTQLTELNKIFAEAKGKQIELEEFTEISQLIVAAQNDDREAFDKLNVGSFSNPSKYNELAGNAVARILSQYLSIVPGFMKFPFEASVDTKKLDIVKIRNYYNNSTAIFHTHLVYTVPDNEIISKRDKMQFYADVLKNDKSLTAVCYAGKFFIELSQDKSLKWNVFDVVPLLKWWEDNKDKIQ